MKKIILTIYTICTMFALSANAKTELITVQGDHGKLDVKIQTPDAAKKMSTPRSVSWIWR